jgi:hypothetical protein
MTVIRQFSHSGIWFNMQQPIQAALRQQYTRAQRTKSSFQIKKKNYPRGKMLRQDSDFSAIDEINDISRNDGGGKK